MFEALKVLLPSKMRVHVEIEVEEGSIKGLLERPGVGERDDSGCRYTWGSKGSGRKLRRLRSLFNPRER